MSLKKTLIITLVLLIVSSIVISILVKKIVNNKYIENRKEVDIIENNISKKNNNNKKLIDELQYINDISKLYKEKSWQDVIKISEKYFTELEETDTAYPESLLYSSYAYYRLYADSKNKELLNKALDSINKYTNRIDNNPIAYNIQGLIYLAYNKIEDIEKAHELFLLANGLNANDQYIINASSSSFELAIKYSYKNDTNMEQFKYYLRRASNEIYPVFIKNNDAAIKIMNTITNQYFMLKNWNDYLTNK